MDMEASLFDLDLGGESWDLSQLLAGPEFPTSFDPVARDLVLPGGSSAGRWFVGDLFGLSPVNEVPQDPLWLDPTDVGLVSGSPQLFGRGLLQWDDVSREQQSKLSEESLWSNDDCSQTIPLTASDFLLGDDLTRSPQLTSVLGTSPMDVKFEFGDVQLNDQAFDFLTDASPQVNDNVHEHDTTFPQFEHSTSSVTSCRPSVSIGSVEFELTPPRVLSHPDSFFPISPLTESCASPLDSLEYDDDDSLHDAKSVCQILLELDGQRRGSGDHGQVLSHVSPEEVDSVLSRDSSSDNLVALVDESCLSIGHSSGAHTVSTGGFTCTYTIANPVASLPTVLISEYQASSVTGKLESEPRSTASKERAQPYHVGGVQIERRVRKKEQNKTAALRYRQKKKEEKGHTMTEVEELELKNCVLKNRADELSKEINYLKGLLDEITRQ